MTHRNQTRTASKPESPACSGNSMEETYLLAMRCPVYRRRDSNPGFRAELENLVGSVKGKGASGRTVRLKVLMGQPGTDCSVVAGKRVMPVERRGQVTGIEVVRVNGKPEELDGLDERRQPLVGGTSRISREAYVRICERLGVQFPGATRRWETGRRLGVSARAHPQLYKVSPPSSYLGTHAGDQGSGSCPWTISIQFVSDAL